MTDPAVVRLQCRKNEIFDYFGFTIQTELISADVNYSHEIAARMHQREISKINYLLIMALTRYFIHFFIIDYFIQLGLLFIILYKLCVTHRACNFKHPKITRI